MKVASCFAVVVFLVGIFLNAGIGFARQNTLLVAGVRLHLGMSLEEAVDRFKGTRYALRPLEGARDAYTISPRSGPPFESPGNLTFRDGNLWWIGKNWGNYFGPDGAHLLNALYGILAAGKKSTFDAEISTSATREPGVIRHEVKINLEDGRTISLSMTEMQKVTKSVSVLEMLGGRR